MGILSAQKVQIFGFTTNLRDLSLLTLGAPPIGILELSPPY
jgi:hypothetical protein